MECDIFIKNADWIITMDKERRIIRNGAIVTEGNKILKVGKSDQLGKEYTAKKVIDGRNRIVTPGLIESHIHCTQILPRGIGDDCDAPQWLYRVMGTFEPCEDEEDARWSIRLCHLEMIKSGTTSFLDIGNDYPDISAEVIGESGLRGGIALGVFDQAKSDLLKIHSDWMGSAQKCLESAENVVKRWHGAYDGRVMGSFSLRMHQNSSDELCKGLKKLADKYHVTLHSHTSYVLATIQACKAKFGMREVERYEQLGLLDSNFVSVHNCWLDFAESLRYKEKGVKVVHCPGASLHGTYGGVSHGLFPEMLGIGIPVSIGSDSGSAGNFVDMLRGMYLAASCFKDARCDDSIMPAETVMEMGTINGAKTLLIEDKVGSLEEGKLADISIFNLDTPGMRPVNNPINNLVYSATGHSADTVIVNGKIIMEHRKLLTMDEEEIYHNAQKSAEKCLEQSGLKKVMMPKWPIV